MESSGDTYEIHLVQGDFASLGNQSFNQRQAGHNSDLRLRGGYSANCASRTLLASNTGIDGLGTPNNGFALAANGNALIEGVIFQGFTRAVVLSDFPSDPRYVFDLRYIIARNIGSNSGFSPLSIDGSVQIHFHDSLIYNCTSSAQTIAAIELGETGAAAASIANVTIANNNGAGLVLFNDGVGPVLAQNVISWGNSGTDVLGLTANGAPPPSIEHSDYATTSGQLTIGAGDFNADPRFTNPGTMDFTLQNNSPLLNAGAPSVPGDYPKFDLNGAARLVGGRVDLGAYESTVDNLTHISVTTTNDNGNNANPTVGSLRAAIKASNASVAPSSITFALPGSCPHVLTLNAVLPNMFNEVTIDGTSQSGWTANSSYGQFDASLCVFLNGNGSLPYALHIPTSAISSARLLVKGILFAGFTDAAVRIEGGGDHVISGNQFGAIAFAQPNTDAIRITGNSDTVEIGGFDDPAKVNLIAGASNNGIYLDNVLGHNIVANNVIGYQPDGIAAGGNGGLGIYDFGSPSNTISYNYVGHNSGGGIDLFGSNANGNVLEFNSIGIDRTVGFNGYPNDAGNSGSGVFLALGAHDNIVGAASTSALGGNSIDYNQGPGVWLDSSAGTGNVIVGNSMTANQGVQLDLDVQGPTANDPSDGDSGPNNLQNYPILTLAKRQSPGFLITGSLDTFFTGPYRLDFYNDGVCQHAGDRGKMYVYLGSATVTTDAFGSASFSLSIPNIPNNLNLQSVAATATDPFGNTSEIGECISTTNQPDQIFKNGFE